MTTMEKNASKPELFEQFLAEKSNATELNQLFDYFGKADEQELTALINAEFENDARLSNPAETQNRLDAIHAKLSDQLFAQPDHQLLRMVKMLGFVKIAAALLVIASIALLVAKFSFKSHNIMPGSSQAMLNLGGTVTRLGTGTDSVIYQQNGVKIDTRADGTIVFMAVNADSATASKLNTLETPRGGEYKVTLSDGSVVMLNAGSKLIFPTDFRGSARKVSVEGEAFFNVAKNALKPFIVSVAGNEIEVLGTHFNVSSYPEDGGTTATLIEGSIKFSNAYGKAILTPNQQAFAGYSKLEVRNVTAEDFSAWTNDEFLFNDVPLTVVMQKLGRWYNVAVDPESMPKKNLYIKISRKADIDEVLDMISKATGYHFELNEHKIVFEK